jgi:serine/threonine protein kinase
MSDANKPPADEKATAPIPLVSGISTSRQTPPPSDPTVRAVPRRKAAPPPPPKHEPGSKVERYVIEKLLGRGGMAEVYQAHDPRLKRKVALKVLHGDSKFYTQKRLFFEAQAAANFQHPNSVIIYDVGETGQDTFIAMELIAGRRLSEFARDTTVPLARKLRWLVAIARALAAAHRKGLVHRDIKPANVMIRDEDSEAKVLDFGIARSVFPEGELEGDITEKGQMVGTVRYAAPEQIRGEPVDGRADQFSWGITGYQLLAGRIPFLDQDTMTVASKVAFEDVPSIRTVAPELPDDVIAAIDKAISKSPDDRFPTMDEAADALEAFAESPTGHQRQSALPPAPSVQSSHAPSPTPLTPGGQTPLGSASLTDPAVGANRAAPPRSGRGRWLAIGGVAIGLAVILAVVALRKPKEQPAAPVAPVRVEVQSLRCAPASVTGEASPEIARALGVAACARLGIEVGVPWGDAIETPDVVQTSITLGPEVQAAIEVRGQRMTGKGATPIHAITQAVASLTPVIFPPALGERELKAWGADDEAGARRIERAWRRRSLWLGGDGSADARSLLQTDAGSPIPHLLTLMSATAAEEAMQTAATTADSLTGKLSPARQNMVKGVLLALPRETNRMEAAKLLRIAYTDAPEDADIAAVFSSFAVQWGLPEGYGALDRLMASAPTRSLWALESALARVAKRDLDRIDKYAAKVGEIFPEAQATPSMIRVHVTRGRVEEARSVLAFARTLGLDKAPADPLVYADSALEVELFAGDAAEARRLSLEILGDPSPYRQVIGGHGVASSHLLEGQSSIAEAVLWENAERHRSVGNQRAAVPFAVRALSLRRLLKQRPVEPARFHWLRVALGEGSTLPPALRAEGLVEVALAQTGLETFRVRTDILQEVEAMANGLPASEVMRRREILVKTIPLIRTLRGDRFAIDLWWQTEGAPFASRLRPAFDAALAMDATGDLKGALGVYQLAADPWNLREGMLERVLAIHRLSKLLPRIGQVAEGAAYKKSFETMWQNAEPAARQALELIR